MNVWMNEREHDEWLKRKEVAAEVSNDPNCLMELANFTQMGCIKIHQALRRNPAVNLRIVNAAMRALDLSREHTWMPGLAAEISAWSEMRMRLLAAG